MALYDERDSDIERRWGAVGGQTIESPATNVMHSVYRHMSLGLAVTGLTAMMASSSPPLLELVAEHPFVLIIAQLGVVLGLSGMIRSISPGTAAAMFYGYSVLTGLTFSTLFLVFTRQSIASTFFVTAGTFGGMSAYGYLTKRDLTGFGQFMIMGLWGLIIASVVGIFVYSSMLQWMITYVGLFIFIGLTAYHTQQIKALAWQSGDEDSRRKVGILGALTLYLDFINLFIRLLSIFGDRRR